MLSVLEQFQLDPQTWMRAGGNRGDVAKEIDSAFEERGWAERRLDLKTHAFLLDRKGQVKTTFDPVYQEGYLVDNVKGRVALDVEWNAIDGNLDRDMTAYRSWHEAGAITAAVIITKHQASLRSLLNRLWGDYNNARDIQLQVTKPPIDMATSTTTNFEKAELRIRRGVMGTCPLLVMGVSESTWNGKAYLGTD
ncbi:BglII/BstYI family type II restriction endonuclease [Scrofimicrobium canadense]|uniref:BglII/BstYI family type II restriction endonuclease n=1 Tax=Scrofimicrobium canadense TaxID=2652290 RepID=UPI00298D72EA|nr:BglII/BstYI family type II restriction endonuclease [Scrofimicrobium canadense]